MLSNKLIAYKDEVKYLKRKTMDNIESLEEAQNIKDKVYGLEKELKQRDDIITNLNNDVIELKRTIREKLREIEDLS